MKVDDPTFTPTTAPLSVIAGGRNSDLGRESAISSLIPDRTDNQQIPFRTQSDIPGWHPDLQTTRSGKGPCKSWL